MGNQQSTPEPVPKDTLGQPVTWAKGDAKEFVGFCALRTGPMTRYNGYSDGSYTSHPMVIREVSPHGHMLYNSDIGDSLSILSPEWNDGQWTRAPDCLCDKINGYASEAVERDRLARCMMQSKSEKTTTTTSEVLSSDS